MDIECEQFHPTLHVDDVEAAARYYTDVLGFRRGTSYGDPLEWTNLFLGDVELHLVKGTPGTEGVSIYFVVGDVDAAYETYSQRGVKTDGAPQDRPYGLRDFAFYDETGYKLVFGQHLGEGAPIDITRIDVAMRIESRLAGLLEDLAALKKMHVGQLIEDIVLHSFEPRGEGVASPYTKRMFARIAALKERHGIDYQAHDNYRFVERG